MLAFLVCPDLTMLAYAVVIALSCFVCSLEEQLGEIQTPRVIEALYGGILSIL